MGDVIYPDPPKPDRAERWIRGACGALLGLFFSFIVWTRAGPFGTMGTVIDVLACLAVCIVGAVRHGDGFWYGVLRR